MLSALDVIYIYDKNIHPGNWKWVVCICPSENLFYRINSNNDYPIGVLIRKDPHHSNFLKWDSYIECGKYPLELDDFQIGEALKANNNKIFGKIHKSHAQEIYGAVQLQSTIARDLKSLIKIALGC